LVDKELKVLKVLKEMLVPKERKEDKVHKEP
jgi:hypothetical protein